METNDPIVTLLDGQKILKSAVPIGMEYINENGQKVKKVLKQEAQQPTNSIFQRFGSKLGNVSKVVSQTVSVASSIVGDKVEKAANAAKEVIADTGDDIADFATAKIKSIVASVNFDETLAALDKYTQESGKDVSALRNFIVELQKFAQDGSK